MESGVITTDKVCVSCNYFRPRVHEGERPPLRAGRLAHGRPAPACGLRGARREAKKNMTARAASYGQRDFKLLHVWRSIHWSHSVTCWPTPATITALGVATPGAQASQL